MICTILHCKESWNKEASPILSYICMSAISIKCMQIVHAQTNRWIWTYYRKHSTQCWAPKTRTSWLPTQGSSVLPVAGEKKRQQCDPQVHAANENWKIFFYLPVSTSVSGREGLFGKVPLKLMLSCCHPGHCYPLSPFQSPREAACFVCDPPKAFYTPWMAKKSTPVSATKPEMMFQWPQKAFHWPSEHLLRT